MKKISLKVLYFVTLTLVFGGSFLIFATINSNSHEEQSKSALLEEARMFAKEMDAVWRFMDLAQPRINYTEAGEFEFKGLHCSIVGKSIGTIFSENTDYRIRYTNFNARNYQDDPDAFETEALTAFNESSQTTEYYRIADFEGEEVFRYLQALEVDASCLECHGEPQGEIDVTGYEKEGWTLSSVGGAISIVIPLDQQMQVSRDNFLRDATYFFFLALLIGALIFFVTSFFVFKPLTEMRQAFSHIQEGRFKVYLTDKRMASEMSALIMQFNSMAGELRSMYEGLEEQVESRTIELKDANALLESQRDDLERLNRMLEKKTRFKSDLLSMVNHELKTPLTSIIALSQITREMLSDEQLDERQAWEEVERNSQVLLDMINNMLDIARSEADSLMISHELVDLGDLADLLKSTIAPFAEQAGITFSTSVGSDVPLVYGDYEKMVRMLENLASNAIKFTPEGGRVELQIRYDAKRHLVNMMMRDDGIGIAAEDQGRIFERFVQVDGTSTRKYSGSGLGLALVQEYAMLLGYDVSVDSTLGSGATFTVSIPSRAIEGGLHE